MSGTFYFLGLRPTRRNMGTETELVKNDLVAIYLETAGNEAGESGKRG